MFSAAIVATGAILLVTLTTDRKSLPKALLQALAFAWLLVFAVVNLINVVQGSPWP